MSSARSLRERKPVSYADAPSIAPVWSPPESRGRVETGSSRRSGRNDKSAPAKEDDAASGINDHSVHRVGIRYGRAFLSIRWSCRI
eukprot:1193713-Prorocentrum_minimum.AAC.3